MHICKKYRTMNFRLFALIFLIAGSSTIYAQNLGSIQRGQRGYSPPARQQDAGEPEKPDVNLLSIERADMYQEILDIDVFTKEVLKSYLKDYYTATVNIGYDENLKFDAKRELINAERKKFENSLKEVFTEEQVEKILTEEEFGKEKKKYDKEKRQEKRKKKKRKKNNDDDGK